MRNNKLNFSRDRSPKVSHILLTDRDSQLKMLSYYAKVMNGKKALLFPKVRTLKTSLDPKNFSLLGGMDFGFRHASVCLLCAKKKQTLYILRELYKKEKTPQEWLKEVKIYLKPYLRYLNSPIRADSQDPGQIKSLQNAGLPVKKVHKVPGSWEKGMKWLASHTILIDPSCYKAQVELLHITTNELRPALKLSTPYGDDVLAALRYAFHEHFL